MSRGVLARWEGLRLSWTSVNVDVVIIRAETWGFILVIFPISNPIFTAWKCQTKLTGTCLCVNIIITTFRKYFPLSVSFKNEIMFSSYSKEFSTVSFISVLTLSATVFVYAYVKKLRTVPGKCFLFFAVGLLTVFLTLPLLHYDFYNDILHFAIAIMLTIGLEFSFLWISVMSFDIWWTFRWNL